MRGKILFVVGLGVGYVLGTRAGREKYEQIKATASKFWGDPRVQKRVDDAQEFVKDKAPEVAGFLADGAKKVVSQVSGSGTTTKSTRKPAARSTAAKSSTAKSTTAKSTASKSTTAK